MCFKSRESIVFKAVVVALLSVLLSQGLGTFESYESIKEVIEDSAPNVPKPTNATTNSTEMGFAPMNLTATSNLTTMSPFATMATATPFATMATATTLPRKRQVTQRTRPMATTVTPKATPKATTTNGNTTTLSIDELKARAKELEQSRTRTAISILAPVVAVQVLTEIGLIFAHDVRLMRGAQPKAWLGVVGGLLISACCLGWVALLVLAIASPRIDLGVGSIVFVGAVAIRAIHKAYDIWSRRGVMNTLVDENVQFEVLIKFHDDGLNKAMSVVKARETGSCLSIRRFLSSAAFKITASFVITAIKLLGALAEVIQITGGEQSRCAISALKACNSLGLTLGAGGAAVALHLLCILWILVLHDRLILNPQFDAKSRALHVKVVVAGVVLFILALGWVAAFVVVMVSPVRSKAGAGGGILLLNCAFEAGWTAISVFSGHKDDLPLLISNYTLLERCVHDGDDARLARTLNEIAGVDDETPKKAVAHVDGGDFSNPAHQTTTPMNEFASARID
jgi:hypothetical protein